MFVKSAKPPVCIKIDTGVRIHLININQETIAPALYSVINRIRYIFISNCRYFEFISITLNVVIKVDE